MEHPELPEQSTPFFNLSIDETAKGYLMDTARWAKFLAVVGFCFVGLLLLIAVAVTLALGRFASGYSALSGFNGLFAVLYTGIALLYFFPVYFLFKFATIAKTALRSGDGGGLTRAFGYLRASFRFIGIVTLILLIIYGLIILIALLGAGFAFF